MGTKSCRPGVTVLLDFPVFDLPAGRMPQETVTDSETRVSVTLSSSKPTFSSESKLLSPRNSRFLLAGLTLLCLLPFIGKPFNIDDPLFVWVAQRVVHHPLDPYGFKVVWYDTEMPMSAVTKNPPLASCYAALIGYWTNWSEVALHLAFLLPAVIVVLATYEFARGMTERPVLAAVLTLAAPAFLVSATSVMCDVPMLALWMLCLLTWRKGLDSENKLYLLTGAMLVAFCALTKYFGACLIPLLAVYSLLRRKTILLWAPFLVLPILVLAGYQIWTKNLYGQGLLSDAAQYSQMVRTILSPSRLGTFFVGLSFTGGCALPVLAMAILIFRKRWIAGAVGLAVLPAILLAFNVCGKFSPVNEHKASLLITLIAFIAGGILTLFLAAREMQKERTADSALLFCWVLGTFCFAAVLNWTVNARSVLPLIPAAAILVARALDRMELAQPTWVLAGLATVPLVISLWLAASDAALAYSARQAAREIAARHSAGEGRLLFMGHWGFQYYMQELGGEPIDMRTYSIRSGDTLVRPKNNANTRRIPPEYVASEDTLEIDVNYGVTLLNINRNAGFYASVAGPLPFAFGLTPPEQYAIYHLKP